MAKLSDEQIRLIWEEPYPTTILMLRAVESAARKEAFREAAVLCKQEAAKWRKDRDEHPLQSASREWASGGKDGCWDCREAILALAEKEGV